LGESIQLQGVGFGSSAPKRAAPLANLVRDHRGMTMLINVAAVQAQVALVRFMRWAAA
jgi:hypothetical protein